MEDNLLSRIPPKPYPKLSIPTSLLTHASLTTRGVLCDLPKPLPSEDPKKERSKLKNYTSGVPNRHKSRNGKGAVSHSKTGHHRSITKGDLKRKPLNENTSAKMMFGSSSYRGRSSKRHISTDMNKSKHDTKRSLKHSERVLEPIFDTLRFNNSVYGKYWRREKIGNRIVITPKLALTPVTISATLISTLRNHLVTTKSPISPTYPIVVES